MERNQTESNQNKLEQQGSNRTKPDQTGLKIRQFIIYYARSLVHLSKRSTDQASDVPSIIFFHNFLQNSLQKLFKIILLYFDNKNKKF